MDLEKLSAKLLNAARLEPEDDRVPYAFEQRILARIKGLRPDDPWKLWDAALWKAAMACLVVSLIFSAWTYTSGLESSTVTLETTVLSMAEQMSDTW